MKLVSPDRCNRLKTARRLAFAAATLALLSACGHAPVVTAPLVRAGAAPGVRDDVPPAATPGAPAGIPQALRDEVADAQKLLGKPLAFKSPAELDAYLRSLAVALPPSAYDREGFLGKLGLPPPAAAGREDGPTLEAVLQIHGYRPGTLVNGKEILPQVMAWDIASNHPWFFLRVIAATNFSVEAPSLERARWKQPFKPLETGTPSTDEPQAHYQGAIAKLDGHPYGLLFDDDFHSGIPAKETTATTDAFSYGTYGTALDAGFTKDQAERIATACDGIDYDTTPYGHTSFGPLGQMDRHFNLDRKGQDTRLVWAARHLDAAENLARGRMYDQAEVELGCGLHSLQDAFAHGQLTPSMHGVIGEFPDQVTYDPVALIEATRATTAYLQAYAKSLGSR